MFLISALGLRPFTGLILAGYFLPTLVFDPSLAYKEAEGKVHPPDRGKGCLAERSEEGVPWRDLPAAVCGGRGVWCLKERG